MDSNALSTELASCAKMWSSMSAQLGHWQNTRRTLYKWVFCNTPSSIGNDALANALTFANCL